MRWVPTLIPAAFMITLLMAEAQAADSGRGRRLAEQRCAACHAVAPNRGNEVADAPPFETIARKFRSSGDAFTLSLIGPHAKMNFSPTRREADDIAAYLRTLAR
jgi:mono/diheme cytochrome c family protein